MTDTTIFTSALESEKTSLEEQLKTIGRPSAETPGEWEAVQIDVEQESDPNDQAAELDQYQENRAILSVLNARYKEVVVALERIQNNTYGICEVSGEPIEQERLEADPAARTCIAHVG